MGRSTTQHNNMMKSISILLAIAGINAQTTTPAPVDPATADMEECVIAADVVGPTVTLARNEATEYMEITMRGDATRWFAFGFGNKFMANAYPIVSVAMGTLVYPNSWASIGNATVTVEDGVRTVTVRRPYSTESTYDFTAFMSASVSSLDVISAIGMENSAGTFAAHALQNQIVRQRKREM